MIGVPMLEMPRIEVGDWFAALVDWVRENLQGLLDLIGTVLNFLFDEVSEGLLLVPPLILAVVLAAIALLVRGWKFGLVALAGLLLIQSMAQWDNAMLTLVLVLIAAGFAMLLALPIGIAAARSNAAAAAIRPVLDFMQTLPAFVYLIPVIFLFGIGAVPGMVATVVFAMPPGVRLTELGIRQVDQEMVEAGHAFGAPPRDILTRIQIPLALPTIMAGVNQVIMLSLSMVVIGAFVGAPGLGADVLSGITRLNLELGFEAGLAVVILAIYLDRVTSGLADRSSVARAQKRVTAGR
ncbi:MAG TPA: ABC transporter permease subunit [Nocardioidaceae bacterium]|nr:ABC transporter permease subunit [Nocardioidaceae bacterium]